MIKPRKIFKNLKLYYSSPEAVIITGMRRTGKTTVLQHIYNDIKSGNKLFIDLENPLNRKYFEEENYERIKTTLIGLGIDFSQPAYLFLDEIQFVRSLPSVVKYFIDHYETKFFLTGSASFYLKNLFTETLAGRKYLFHLYPLSFQEFLQFKGSSITLPARPENVTKPLHDTISNLYDEYVLYGGFPGVVLKDTVEEKNRSLDDIFTSFFHLEVTQLGDFKRNNVIRDLMLLLMQRAGTRLDIQKISKELGIARPTIKEYIAFLQGTFFVNTVPPLSKGKDIEIRKAPKIYGCDSGLLNRFAKLDRGPLFENSVLQNLLPAGEVHYYQRKSGVEIDFILSRMHAYEVKIHPEESDVKRLSTLAHELELETYDVVSKDYTTLPNALYAFQLGGEAAKAVKGFAQ
ncbi:MAG: ATP-binding protein [Ignavibacteria bacterium]|nr:ATP-binding protein [Ignavibacteria bacterium]